MAGVDLGPTLTCRGCGDAVRYAATETGKRILIDARPDHRGALVVFRDDTGRLCAYHGANAPTLAPWYHASPDRYTLHRGCPRRLWPDPVAEEVPA